MPETHEPLTMSPEALGVWFDKYPAGLDSTLAALRDAIVAACRADEAERIATAKREGRDAAQAFICGPAIAGAVLDAERDRLYPLPARECVRCALCQQAGADLSTGTHATRDECIEALGAALKSFAAGVGR